MSTITNPNPDKNKMNLAFWIKVIIAVLTGIASALGTSACIHALK